MELRPHQRDAVNNLRSGCVLWGGVGSGKTITSLFFFVEKMLGGTPGNMSSVKTPMNILVLTTARKRDSLDWEKEAATLGIGKEGATIPGVVLTVDSWNNIDKYVNVTNTFIIADEQRLVGSGMWVKSFIKMTANNPWILLSATPGDSWMDYVPIFIANGFVKNRTEFKRNHVVYTTYAKFPKVERYVGLKQLRAWREQILVEMPYETHTTRHDVDVPVSYDEELMKKVLKKRWNPFEDRPMKDMAELFGVMRRVSFEDESRAEAVYELLTRHNRLIVFYSFDYELSRLRALQSRLEGSGVQFAEWNGHKHEKVPESERWIYLVQYVAGAEAWNCTTTNAVVFHSLTYSYKNYEQAKGRIDRLDTPFLNLFYYSLVSKSPIDRAVSKALHEKRSFNERADLIGLGTES